MGPDPDIPRFALSTGAFQGVRTFGGQIKHLAAANYQIGAKILGEEPPHHEHDEEAPNTVRTKPEILEYLKESFAYLHHAIAAITGDTLVEPIPGVNSVWQNTRLGLAIDAVAHCYDHYGQMVEYLTPEGRQRAADRRWEETWYQDAGRLQRPMDLSHSVLWAVR